MMRSWHVAAWIWCSVISLCFSPAEGDDQGVAPSPAETPTDSAFVSGEISVGEPLQVPFRKPDAAVPPPDVPTTPSVPSELPPVPRRFSAPDDAATPPSSPPAAKAVDEALGSGWLGITVDDSLVPGRLVVVEVAPEGPAALAGLEPQDLLLGINGSPLRTSDEMAAILATIAPGMTVKAAVGKGERVEERSLVATKRPSTPATPGWQGSTGPGAVVTVPPVTTPPAAQFQPPAGVSAMPSPRDIAPPRTPATAPTFTPPADAAPLASADSVSELPAPALAAPSGPVTRGRTALGVRTVPVDAAVQARYRLPEASGAYVIGVVGDLPASKAGVPPGSVIVAIRNQPVRGPQDLTRLVTSGPVGAPVPLQYVLPGGESREAEVVLQSLELPLERVLVGDNDPAAADADGTRRAERFEPPTIAPTAASTALPLEEEVRQLRRQVEDLERRLQRLEPRLLR